MPMDVLQNQKPQQQPINVQLQQPQQQGPSPFTYNPYAQPMPQQSVAPAPQQQNFKDVATAKRGILPALALGLGALTLGGMVAGPALSNRKRKRGVPPPKPLRRNAALEEHYGNISYDRAKMLADKAKKRDNIMMQQANRNFISSGSSSLPGDYMTQPDPGVWDHLLGRLAAQEQQRISREHRLLG